MLVSFCCRLIWVLCFEYFYLWICFANKFSIFQSDILKFVFGHPNSNEMDWNEMEEQIYKNMKSLNKITKQEIG